MPFNFNEIFAVELRSLQLRRRATRRPRIPRSRLVRDLPSVDLGLTGVSLSGGGVRSASFCLGVLQALNALVGLHRFDYLSTVSGGGYIGAATTIGMSVNKGRFPFGHTGEDPGETGETQHLRDNSRYLVKDGVPSIVSALAVYLRGIAMNVMIVLPLMLVLAALLVAATAARAAALHWAAASGGAFQWLAGAPFALTALTGMVLAAALVIYAVGVSVARIAPLEERQWLARMAGLLVTACTVLVLLFDLHPALLLHMLQPASPEATAGAAPRLQVLQSLLDFANRFGLVLAPVVAVLVPYLKPIVTKAVSSGEGWGDLAKRIGSRALLLIVAALVPLLLWAWTLQLAFWGLYDVACGALALPGPERGAIAAKAACDSALAAPGWLSWLFATASTGGAAGSPTALGVGVVYIAGAALMFATWPFLNVNANSLHQLYRDRLGSAFLIASAEDAIGRSYVQNRDDFLLSDIDERHAPYHLFNAALNVPGSKEANQRGRNADFFILSRCFIGSPLTGYVRTADAEGVMDRLNLGAAMAISGAAAAPNMGMVSMRPLSPTIALLNVRLGRWLRHPAAIEADVLAQRKAPRPGPWYFLREAFSKSGLQLGRNGVEGIDKGPIRGLAPNSAAPEEGKTSDFVFLTDGGHIENLGVYELLRRRCKLIVAVDAEADPAGRFFALEQLERFARIDLGTKIVIDVRPIARASAAVTASVERKEFPERKAGPHVAVGSIDYPPREGTDGPREQGVLVYVKASMSGDENDYVCGYKLRNPAFPQETTADQFFSEEQLEAYRALGEHAMRRFLTGQDEFAAYDDRRLALYEALTSLLPGGQFA